MYTVVVLQLTAVVKNPLDKYGYFAVLLLLNCIRCPLETLTQELDFSLFKMYLSFFP
jgi:hypothetical protein